ncbi:techylectin-5B-like [Tachypleus tridentatus]|uniref:techylectin-5B-like n=1 Tax=Tachypleus tridentatus TaxID=6853 RepID=UPI003FD6B4C8
MKIFTVVALLLSIYFPTESIQHFHTTCNDVGILEGIVDSMKELGEMAKQKIATIEGPVCSKRKGTYFHSIPENGKYIPSDCADVYYKGIRSSGIYEIWPRFLNHPIDVRCDMENDNGGWTIIQRRGDFDEKSDFFYQPWDIYKTGFGNLSKEFWLGNEPIFALSNQKKSVLRIDLKDFEGHSRYAEYSGFVVRSEVELFQMTYTTYKGDAGDSLDHHKGASFSTKDMDNDNHKTHCSQRYKGGWWYNACHHANLNGLYLRGNTTEHATGVTWFHWKGHDYSLKTTEMKLRPLDFAPDIEIPK